MTETSLDKRMKNNYENRYRIKLTRRTPVIMRLDGRAFHTLTKNCVKPYDERFNNTMIHTASYLASEVQGAKCGYIQSDEISLLITDFDGSMTDAWFDYNIQKMTSISAGIASVVFTSRWVQYDVAVFDSRVFNVPKEEVCNYFVSRQKDWIRNSLTMYAQSVYSHKELHKKNSKDKHEMLHDKGLNWASLDDKWKNGTFIFNEGGGWSTRSPIIEKNRDLIERYLLI